jgi:predicted amidohydrolase
MERVNIDTWTFDVGAEFATPADCAAQVTQRVISSWDDGADIVVFPEFAWMVLERFVAGPDKLQCVAHLFWNDLWPGIQSVLHRTHKAAVLGTVPFLDKGGVIRNRAPILCGGQFFYQDKIHLTPWETAFTGGGPLRIWTFRGVRIATVICLDIEVPELSAALRGRNVELLLVPSATETALGIERVHRCASARSVELGCHAVVSQLVGRMESELIDENIGMLATYSPSQSVFAGTARHVQGPTLSEGFHRMSVCFEIAALREASALTGETNPSLLSISDVDIIE